jgi:hypothetical protein
MTVNLLINGLLRVETLIVEEDLKTLTIMELGSKIENFVVVIRIDNGLEVRSQLGNRKITHLRQLLRKNGVVAKESVLSLGGESANIRSNKRQRNRVEFMESMSGLQGANSHELVGLRLKRELRHLFLRIRHLQRKMQEQIIRYR